MSITESDTVSPSIKPDRLSRGKKSDDFLITKINLPMTACSLLNSGSEI